jgi:hypothetical protein
VITGSEPEIHPCPGVPGLIRDQYDRFFVEDRAISY